LSISYFQYLLKVRFWQEEKFWADESFAGSKGGIFGHGWTRMKHGTAMGVAIPSEVRAMSYNPQTADS
jgi:hypothetical protein